MLETFEILDRFELLYPEITELSDLRRAYIDEDLSSIFRLTDKEELRKAVIEENLHSIFRIVDQYDTEDLRKAVIEKNLHSIFRLLEIEDIRKLVMEDNTWSLWKILSEYKDTQFVAALKNFFINNINYDKDCFSRGQLQSKIWLIQELKKCNVELGTVFLCAGWYATLSVMLFESGMQIEKIRSFDIDPSTTEIAKIFNKPWLMEDWKFQASIEDIHNINYNYHEYEVTRSDNSSCVLLDTPRTIINTSCEHIKEFTEWYNKIPTGKLVVLQSNNYFEVEEHVNCVADTDDFDRMAPMDRTLFIGELKLEKYSRYMKIGYK